MNLGKLVRLSRVGRAPESPRSRSDVRSETATRGHEPADAGGDPAITEPTRLPQTGDAGGGSHRQVDAAPPPAPTRTADRWWSHARRDRQRVATANAARVVGRKPASPGPTRIARRDRASTPAGGC